MPKMKLFFIPHAGGSSMGYMALKRFLDTECIMPVPLEPAGRGMRINEPCFSEVKESARDLAQKVKAQITDGEYAVFGHSLGALLAFETARELRKEGVRLPKCIFVSGRCAPQTDASLYPSLSGLDNEEFIKRFTDYQAMPQEFLQNEEIMNLMLPILRTDIKMAESYRYEEGEPLSSDICVLYGRDDVLSAEEGMKEWKHQTSGCFSEEVFPGGHFYYKDQKEALGNAITGKLKQYT